MRSLDDVNELTLFLLNAFGRDIALNARMKAITERTTVTLSKEIGRLLGGNVTLTLEFDETKCPTCGHEHLEGR